MSRSVTHGYQHTIHHNSYLIEVEDALYKLYHWFGGIIEGGDVHQIPIPQVYVIIVDDTINEGVCTREQGNEKRLPLLWAGCICGKIQGEGIIQLAMNK